jgi:hypothetical protein
MTMRRATIFDVVDILFARRECELRKLLMHGNPEVARALVKMQPPTGGYCGDPCKPGEMEFNFERVAVDGELAPIDALAFTCRSLRTASKVIQEVQTAILGSSRVARIVEFIRRGRMGDECGTEYADELMLSALEDREDDEAIAMLRLTSIGFGVHSEFHWDKVEERVLDILFKLKDVMLVNRVSTETEFVELADDNFEDKVFERADLLPEGDEFKTAVLDALC